MTMRVAFIAARLAPTIAWVWLSRALVAWSKKISRGLRTSARDHHALPRATGELASTFHNEAFEPHRHGGDVGVEAGLPDRFRDLVARQRGAAGDVAVDAAGDEDRRFQDGADLAAQQAEVERFQVFAVVVVAAERRRFEADQQAQKRRLARPRAADDGNVLARAGLKIDALESPRPFPGVTERQVADGDKPAQRARVDAAFLDLERRLEHGTDAGEERRCLDGDVERGGEVEKGGGELAKSAVESRKGSNIDGMGTPGGNRQHADGAQDGQARGGDRLVGSKTSRPGIVGALLREGGTMTGNAPESTSSISRRVPTASRP